MPVARPGVIVDHVIVDGKIGEVFNFMADFTNSLRWDPGVVAAARANDESGPVHVGSEFNLTTRFKGKDSQMVYKLVALDSSKHEIVLTGDGSIIKAVDTMKLSQLDDGKVRIDYTADLSLKSFRKPFILFLKGALDKLGTEAMNGISNYYKYGDKQGKVQDHSNANKELNSGAE